MNEEQYLLDCLMEECMEVGHSTSKAIRFGLDDIHPDGGPNNQERIQRELCDLFAIVEMLEERGLLSFNETGAKRRMEAKKVKVLKYMNYSKARGRVK